MIHMEGGPMDNATELSPLEAIGSALGAAGYAAHSMTLVGNAAPVVTAYGERVRNPQPGDLVVETSSFAMRDAKGLGFEAVGTLLKAGVEHIIVSPSEDEPDGWEYDEEAWYVTPIVGGETVRWTNAEFVAIPRSARQAWDWKRS